MDSAKGVGQVKPADTQGLVLSLGFTDDGQELEVMLCTPWDTVDKRLLHRSVQVLILRHVGQPSLLQQAGEDLAYAGCESDWPKVGWLARVLFGILLPQ